MCGTPSDRRASPSFEAGGTRAQNPRFSNLECRARPRIALARSNEKYLRIWPPFRHIVGLNEYDRLRVLSSTWAKSELEGLSLIEFAEEQIGKPDVT